MKYRARNSYLVDDHILADTRPRQSLHVRDAQWRTLIHPRVSLRGLRPQPRLLLPIRRVADQATGQRAHRRADQRILPAVTVAPDGRAGQRAGGAPDQYARTRVVGRAVGIDAA